MERDEAEKKWREESTGRKPGGQKLHSPQRRQWPKKTRETERSESKID